MIDTNTNNTNSTATTTFSSSHHQNTSFEYGNDAAIGPELDHYRSATAQPIWERDTDAPCCKRCKKKFKTLYRNRHHCRCCGYVFCGKCTHHRMHLPEFGYDEEVRVCNVCYNYTLA